MTEIDLDLVLWVFQVCFFRRMIGDLLEVDLYKITHEIYDPLALTSLFTFNNIDNTRTNGLKLMKPRVNTATYQNVFTNKTIN